GAEKLSSSAPFRCRTGKSFLAGLFSTIHCSLRSAAARTILENPAALRTVTSSTTSAKPCSSAIRCAAGSSMPIRPLPALHLVIVGGGATGVELAAELSHYMETLSRYATDEMPTHLRMTLIETGPRLLGPFPERISKSVEAKLRQLGIDVRTNAKVVGAD